MFGEHLKAKFYGVFSTLISYLISKKFSQTQIPEIARFWQYNQNETRDVVSHSEVKNLKETGVSL